MLKKEVFYKSNLRIFMKDGIISGLDIGSTAVRMVVGQIGREGKLQIIGAVSAPTEGLHKGVVKSIEDVTSSISMCLEKAERLIGVPIEHAWVSINSPIIKCEKSRGVVAIGRGDGEISHDDIERALAAARALSVPPNYEILHVIPVKYSVDNQEDIKDPIGMSGVRLEVETLIIQVLSSQSKNLTKAIFRTGIDIEDLILSPLAAAEAVITSKQKEIGSAVVNIGASITSLAVFEEGELLHTAIIPIGSEHITADIAIGLRCPISLAEKIKLNYGCANSEIIGDEDEVDITELVHEEAPQENISTVALKYLSEIIEARVEEIYDKIDIELKKIDRSGMLPGGIYLIGGGAKMRNIVDVGKRKLRLPVSLGSNIGVQAIIDKVNDLEYLNALGLVVWGNNVSEQMTNSGQKIPGKEMFQKTLTKAKSWIKSLIP